jgi:hypothetical protein
MLRIERGDILDLVSPYIDQSKSLIKNTSLIAVREIVSLLLVARNEINNFSEGKFLCPSLYFVLKLSLANP